jgi:hypothetical protein
VIVDNALANFTFLWNVRCGDTGRRRVEHINFLQLRFTHIYCNDLVRYGSNHGYNHD